MDAAAAPELSLRRQGWNFARHFLEMCITMCVGGTILSVLVFTGLPTLIGGSNLRALFPELSLVVIAIVLTLPMAAWMAVRGMEWRPILEMSAVPIGLAILLIGAAGAGIAPKALEITFGSFCGISCVGMFVVMLFRLDLYTGRTGHVAAHGTNPAHAT